MRIAKVIAASRPGLVTVARRPLVAFYMHDLSGGGVERMRLNLIEELRGRGMSIVLVLDSRQGSLQRNLPSDLPVHVLGGARSPGNLAALARFLRRERPEFLVSSLGHNNVLALIANALAGFPAKTVICQHNALSAEQRLGLKYRCLPALYRILAPWADSLIAVSEGVADDLAKVTGIARSRIETIYNPVIDRHFARRLLGPAPHPWLEDRSCPVFVFVGRLTAQKDPATLLRAMASFIELQPARLILLGEGELITQLRALILQLRIENSVVFAGYQINPLPWIRRADALVLTSRYEGLGNVIIEALACGTPVIATDCPYGPAEILMRGKYGRLVPVGDSAALARAMRECLSQSWDSDSMRLRAAAFSTTVCADRHRALFERISNQHRQGRKVFGLRLWQEDSRRIVDRIVGAAPDHAVHLVVTPNLDHIRLLREPNFAAACDAADIVCADGLPVALYGKLRGLRLTGRVTGCDIVHHLLAHPGVAGQRLFLIVESEPTSRAVLAWAAQGGWSERLRVAVAPPHLARDVAAQHVLASAIRAHRPSILLICLGAPVSETFVHLNRGLLPACWALCVGQAMRIELGLVRRAPGMWQRLGMEWLWRMLHEPRRLAPRYAKALAWFPIAVLRDLRAARSGSVGGLAS